MTVRDGERPHPVGIPVADDSKLNAGVAVQAPALASGARRDHFDIHVQIPRNRAFEASINLPHSRFAQSALSGSRPTSCSDGLSRQRCRPPERRSCVRHAFDREGTAGILGTLL